MKNKHIIYSTAFSLICCFITTLFSCQKNNNSTTSQPDSLHTIEGTLYVNDYYSSNNDSFTKSGVAVHIRIASTSKDSSNYFYSTLTDIHGNFAFYVTDTTLNYEVFTFFSHQSSSSFNPLYYAAVMIPGSNRNPGSYTLSAHVDTFIQNGVHISVVDAAGNRINKASITLYTSKIIALAEGIIAQASSCFANLKTDSLGNAFISNLPKDSLYVNSWLISGKDTFKTLAVPISIPPHSIVPLNLTLH